MRGALQENASDLQRRQRESAELANQRAITGESVRKNQLEGIYIEYTELKSKVLQGDSVNRIADPATIHNNIASRLSLGTLNVVNNIDNDDSGNAKYLSKSNTRPCRKVPGLGKKRNGRLT
jgi:hypothetical protein